MKSLVVSALAFAVTLLLVNRDAFQTARIEHGDYAANSLVVQDAKHFKALLGNYSRWEFNHPGPVFFYGYAAGEALLYDVAGLVPDPFNAQIVTIILLNSLLLAIAVALMRPYWPSPWFPPLAFASATLIAGVINHRIPGSAFVSLWPPHVLLAPFVLFSVAATSIACGALNCMPYMVLAGGFLVHGHIAQPLFVGSLGALALVCCWWRTGRNVRALLSHHQRALGVSAAIVLVTLFPIVLELLIHKPNNLDAVRAYAARQRGQEWPLHLVFQYVQSFFLFMSHPHKSLFQPGGLSDAYRDPFVWIVWSGFAVAAATVGVLHRRVSSRSSQFRMTIAAGIGTALVLFFFWATRITGRLYNFNGYFIFSVFVLFGLILAGMASDVVAERGARFSSVALAILPAIAFAFGGDFLNRACREDEVTGIVRAVENERSAKVALVFEHNLWPLSVGLASRMQRRGQPYCVPPKWGFMCGSARVCPDVNALRQVRFNLKSVQCEPPCERIAYATGAFTVSVWQPAP